jgi:hypothetical protein
MSLNTITGFLSSKTAIWLTEEYHLKEKLIRMKIILIISKKENSGTSGNICRIMNYFEKVFTSLLIQ